MVSPRGILIAFAATVVSGLSPTPTLSLNTGAAMPALGFGTYRLNGEELSDALRCAIAAGYRHIDTAAGYENEHVVAAAIAESGIPREEFFLTSKLWCTDHGDEAFDAALSSLAQLDTDYLDLYLMHAPNNLGESAEDKVELRRQSWAAMTALHEAGCLRAIGVSNFEPRHIEQLLQWGEVTPAVNQVETHAYLGQAHIREYCDAKGIALTSFGSVGAEGLLSDPTVRRIAEARGRLTLTLTLTLAQTRTRTRTRTLALALTLTRPEGAVPRRSHSATRYSAAARCSRARPRPRG